MALNMCELWSNGFKIALIFQKKTTKNCPAAKGLALRPPSLRQLIHLSYTSLLNTFGGFKLSLQQNPDYVPTHRPRLLIFQSAISLSHKKFFFQKILMTSLHVVCPLPLMKNSGYAYGPACSYCRKRKHFFGPSERIFAPPSPPRTKLNLRHWTLRLWAVSESCVLAHRIEETLLVGV